MRLLLTPADAATALGSSRTTIYELMRAGALESVKIGRARRIPTTSLEAYVERLRGGADTGAGPTAA